MQSLLSWSKSYRRLLVWAAVLTPVLWWFNYYVMIPVCMPYSKPVTMYLEWNEKQRATGTPKRAAFRIPSAYLTRLKYMMSGGKKDFVSFEYDSVTGDPYCLANSSNQIESKRVSVKVSPGINKITPEIDITNTLPLARDALRIVDTGEKQFTVYVPKFSRQINTEYIIPKGYNDPRLYFSCIVVDGARRGCSAYTSYKAFSIRYSFHNSRLKEWGLVQQNVYKTIDSFISDIDS